MTYAEIYPETHDFRAVEVGRKKNPNGTWSRITEGVTFIRTPSGMIPDDEWAKLAFKAVTENNDLPLLEAIEANVRDRCLWLKENEIRSYSLECLLLGAYKVWAERGDFVFTDGKKEDDIVRMVKEACNEEEQF